MRGTSEYVGKELILIPDQETSFTDLRHGSLTFTPVVFKNKRKGFRLVEVWNGMSFGQGITTNAIAYVALSDKPVKVSEDDVEIILEYRRDYGTGRFVAEWKPFEREDEAQDAPPNREVPVTVTGDETPVNVAENGPSEEKSKSTTFWFYALIPLCLLVILCLMRRKPAS